METSGSSSGSLTSRSTESMEIDTFNSPPRSDTPLNDTLNSLSTDTEKGIVVDAPSLGMAESSALMIGQDEDDEDEVVPFVKRKRPSINYNLDRSEASDTLRGSPSSERPVKRSRLSQKIRGVIIGVWRDSDRADDADKHVIYGFIDIHDRLRTRIYGMNRKVLKAKAIVAQQEAASPGGKPVVHRASTGRQSLGNNRQSLPRQTIHKTPSFQAVNAADMQTPKASPFTEGKPHGILIGYWADSDQLLEADKHAVFGVLSGVDAFRVKVQKVTRDGRFVEGNFPVGAGALWLHFEKAVLEPHLAGLSRTEVKEYCRLRYQDLEHRESEKERKANELKAVQKARTIVAEQSMNNGIEQDNVSPEVELRHSARSEHRASSRHQAALDDAAVLKAQKEKAEARERQHEQTRKEVALAEAALKGPEAEIQGAAHMELKNNIKKLNKVWLSQQAATLPGTVSPSLQPDNEVRYHNGIKYERKKTGPFQGKLVSQPQILVIDGEDYVEYRVLTQPSF